jgi:hypothetical protein
MNIVDFKEWLEQFPEDTEIVITIGKNEFWGGEYFETVSYEIFNPNDINHWTFIKKDKELHLGH